MRLWDVLHSAKTYQLGVRVDEDIVRKAQSSGCSQPGCSGHLYRTDYQRKARVPYEVHVQDELAQRYSLCCGSEGCRKRYTPPSVRFWGRRWYAGVVVLLVSVVSSGSHTNRLELNKLMTTLNVDMRTVKRWKAWWRTTFERTKFWQAKQGLLSPLQHELPALERLWLAYWNETADSVITLLQFLSPITVSGGCAACAK